VNSGQQARESGRHLTVHLCCRRGEYPGRMPFAVTALPPVQLRRTGEADRASHQS
jgi:hypothetical protein